MLKGKMKKTCIMKSCTLFICLFVFYLLSSGVCLSAPVGNPAGPVLVDGSYPTKLNMEVETVLERKLESDSSGNPKFSGTFYTGKLSLYLGNKLDLYCLVGTYEGKIKDFISTSYSIDSKLDVVLGGGVSYVLYGFELLHGIVRLGADAKYRQFDPDIDSVKLYREKVETTSNSLSFKEWQAALGLSYQYKNFAPYIGIKYSDMDSHVKFTHDTTSRSDSTLSSKETWGMYYGIDVLVVDNVSVNFEARNMDEKAFSAGLSARF